jgi:hypothetical protein
MSRRLVFLLPAAVAALAGLDAGLLLLGVPAPVASERLPNVHGMVMVLGFVGTVIALERAVALRRRAGYLAPVLLGSGGLLLVFPAPLLIGQSALAAGASALVAIYVPLWQRQRDDSVLIQAFGAVLAAGGALLWLGGRPVSDLLPWLTGFIVLTIAGERLELARVMLLSPATVAQLRGLAFVISLATLLTLLLPAAGYPVLGLSLIALVLWLMVHDVARRTIRGSGLPRFMAGALLTGYAWLAVTGAIWVSRGPVTGGFAYDALIHAVFLGFTISMIMAHAPVILPAILHCRLPYHPVMIAAPVLLHTSLFLRLAVGDGFGINLARQIGGTLNVVSLLAFAAITVGLSLRAGRSRRVVAASVKAAPGAPAPVARAAPASAAPAAPIAPAGAHAATGATAPPTSAPPATGAS